MIDNILTVVMFIFTIPMVYIMMFSSKEKDERGKQIINTSFHNAYFILLLGIFLVVISSKLAIFDMDFQTFGNLIVLAILISLIVAGMNIFINNRRM
ncbi:hypothetical protein [Bacillus thuringiensis]|uniref:hypothetical protein n=1 Tax=Bacillus cereus group TaxID=86661 RepID=UPI000BEBDAE7|nr:hypothetical protein [Bacillus thuringiensis]MCU5131752.1 hypothetical protein [Bacillus cereus]MCU5544477.1 hypothetical protein [Bacillus cereus]MED3528199.1 hypothetical protein [Bacillus thuringiensis]PEA58514.1 hypothetical protein CON74_23055 [Bacillus thuringiensis]PEW23740.1 hypothetical protein CN427_29320 [Bacillus thuringiensis]